MILRICTPANTQAKIQEGKGMKKHIVAVGLVAMLLTGCAGQVELSEADNARVAQYAANLMLKYDSNYKERLLSEEEMKEAKEKLRIAEEKEAELQALLAAGEKNAQEEENSTTETAEGVESGIKTDEQEQRVVYTLQEALKLEGFEISSEGYSVVEEYPQDLDAGNSMTVNVRASAGKKLLVMKYQITNTTQEALECDLFSKDISGSVVINGSTEVNSMVTMLLNDLVTLKEVIEPGAVYEAVQVYEIPEEASNIEQMQLNMEIGSEVYAIEL